MTYEFIKDYTPSIWTGDGAIIKHYTLKTGTFAGLISKEETFATFSVQVADNDTMVIAMSNKDIAEYLKLSAE